MKTKFLSNKILKDILDNATKDERITITKALSPYARKTYKSEEIVDKISRLGSSYGLYNLFRGEGTSYIDILIDIAEKLEIKNLPSYELDIDKIDNLNNIKEDKYQESDLKCKEIIDSLETRIQTKFLEKYYDSLEQNEKVIFDEKLAAVLNSNDNSLKYLGGTAGILALGNLGGFATYTFLSSALSTLSFGTLGFGAYIGASSIVSVLLGPVGWGALAFAALYKFSGPSEDDFKKLIHSIFCIIAIKYRIKMDKNTTKIQHDINLIELLNFEKIYRYCKQTAESGNTDINLQYILDNGKMHKALIYSFLEKHIHKLDDKNDFTIIDWGCSLGLNSLLFLDYIREKQCTLKIKQIVLIEQDVTKLNLAKILIQALGKNIEVMKINKSFQEIKETDLIFLDTKIFNIFTECNKLTEDVFNTLPITGGLYLNIYPEECTNFEKLFDFYSSIFGSSVNLLALQKSKIGKYSFSETFFEVSL